MSHGEETGWTRQVEFKDGRCPDCPSSLFHPGPRGGRAINIQCAQCGHTFWYSPPFTPERIPTTKGVYNTKVQLRLTEITQEDSRRNH